MPPSLQTKTYIIKGMMSIPKEISTGTCHVLTIEQEHLLDSIKDPVIRADKFLHMTGMDISVNETDQNVSKIRQDCFHESSIIELYWNIVSDCESQYLPLFNRLNSFHLLNILYPDHSM